MNNDQSKKRHDASPQHQDAVKRFVGKIQKEDREKSKLLKDFTSKTGLLLEATQEKQAKVEVQASASSFYTKPAEVKRAPVPLLSVRPPPVPRALALKKIASEPIGSIGPIGHAPEIKVEDKVKEDTEEKEKIMAQSAIVGQWETVSDSPLVPFVEPKVMRTDKREELITETFKVTEKVIESSPGEDGKTVEFIKKSTVRRNIRQ